MGEMFAGIAGSGALVPAIGVAMLAGLVSFLSPCVLPLVPGYVSYVAGMTGADATGERRRAVAGTVLFIAGFTAVFVLTAVLVANVGRLLFAHARAVEMGVGALTILMGVSFLGLLPIAQVQRRPRWMPSPGLAGSPLLGVVFGLGWVPCVSPTLSAVLGLAAVDATVDRAVLLAIAYCAGLGAPFVLVAAGLGTAMKAVAVARRHGRAVSRVGGALMIVVGVLLMTGWWSAFTIWLRTTVGPGQVGI